MHSLFIGATSGLLLHVTVALFLEVSDSINKAVIATPNKMACNNIPVICVVGSTFDEK